MASLLIVEDDEDTLNLMRRWLEQVGHEVVGVPDGEQAIDLGTDGRYDLLVVDVNLPGIDGFEVARRLRQPPGHRVLICTVSEREDAPTDVGEVDWLIKPFGRIALLAAVDAALKATDA